MNPSEMPDSGTKRPPPRFVMQLMGLMRRMSPPDPSGENSGAVRAFQRMDAVLDVLKGGPLKRRLRSASAGLQWPVAGGDYAVGHAKGSVAVCTLSSKDLYSSIAEFDDVAMAGKLITVNLGIERLIQNVTANPAIRALVLCGRDSPIFHTAQGIRSLIENGVDESLRIVGAMGHLPVLRNLSADQIAHFRQQVMLVEAVGVTELAEIRQVVAGAAAQIDDVVPVKSFVVNETSSQGSFKPVAAGGTREPLAYDPNGFFIISLDRPAGEIVCRHYHPDNSPGHEVRSRSAERITLALVRENLISQMSHAAYLGGELAKAEAALYLNLEFEQDKHLRHRR